MSGEAGSPGHSDAWKVWVATIIVIEPATFLVGARFYARIKSQAGVKEDDWTILAALSIDWVFIALRWYQIDQDGFGLQGIYLSHKQKVDYNKAFLAVQAMYFTTAVLTKTSILRLYRRIFGVHKRFVWVLWGAQTLVALYFFICLFVSIFGCNPVSLFWNKDQPGSCINETAFFRWNGVANLLLDCMVLVLPLPMVWRLQLRVQQKIALSGIFLLGGFACLASILRIVQFTKGHQNDPTFTGINSGLWSAVEQTIGIICACLPTLRPLLRFKGWGNSTDGQGASLPYYHDHSFELNGGKNRRQTRTQATLSQDPWEKEAESDSVIGLAFDGQKPTVSSASHDDDGSDEGAYSSQPMPAVGIMRTREVHQDVASLNGHAK